MAKVIPIIPGGEVGASHLTSEVHPKGGYIHGRDPAETLATATCFSATVTYTPPQQRFYREFSTQQEAHGWASSVRAQIQGAEAE